MKQGDKHTLLQPIHAKVDEKTFWIAKIETWETKKA